MEVRIKDVDCTVNVRYPDKFGFRTAVLAYSLTLISGRPFDNRMLIIKPDIQYPNTAKLDHFIKKSHKKYFLYNKTV
jgi:hypothetical protein